MQVRELHSWDDLRAFLAVAKHGSFTEAARHLSVVQTTVSRRVAALESQLGAKLFTGGKSGLRLTHRGNKFLSTAAAVERAFNDLEREHLGPTEDAPVRIATTDGLAAFWLSPHLPGFHRLHPSIRLEIVALNTWSDLALRGDVDIVLRSAPPADETMVGRRVGQVQFKLYGTPAYFEAHGFPRSYADLRDHIIIENVGLRDHAILGPWLRGLTDKPSMVSTNSSVAVLASVLAGTGLGLLPATMPDWIADSDFRARSKLIMVDLPLDLKCDFWILSRKDTNKSKQVRSVLSFLAKEFR